VVKVNHLIVKNLSIYVYIHMYIHIHMCIHLCMFINVYIYIYTYIGGESKALDSKKLIKIMRAPTNDMNTSRSQKNDDDDVKR
jgi:hypothetical protein